MRALKGLAMVAGLVVGVSTAPSCVNGTGSPPGDIGTIGLELQIAPGVTLGTVDWSITNAATSFSRTGSVGVLNSNTLRFQVGGLPGGTGYVLALSAVSTNGLFTCAGRASFNVTAGMTVGVAVTLTCTAVGNNGNVVITGTTEVCASITSLSAAPLETAVNTTVALAATATAGAVAPMFLWTASAGTFDNAASPSPVFTCPPTPADVTITVNVTPTAPSCTTTSQSVTVTCDTLNPTFTNIYATIIGMRCISCHRPGGGGVTVGGLDMSTQAAAYANLVGVAAAGTGAGTSGVTCASLAPNLLRVTPNDAAASLLHDKVSSKLAGAQAACGSPMPNPASAPPLTQAQIDLIAAWINAGAAND